MFMTDQDPFTRSSHAVLFVVLFQPFQPRHDRWVFLRLCFFGSEGIVGEWVKADGSRLIRREAFRYDWTNT